MSRARGYAMDRRLVCRSILSAHLLFFASCIDEDPERPLTNMLTSAPADDLIAHVQATFRIYAPDGSSTPVLAPSPVVGYMEDANSIVPVFPASRHERVHAVAPPNAEGTFIIRDSE